MNNYLTRSGKVNRCSGGIPGWLNRLRIEKAKELLTAHPEWSNEAVARECGFTDRSYFQRKFKELTGRTPAEWRA